MLREDERSGDIITGLSAQEFIARRALREIRLRQQEGRAVDKRIIKLATKSQAFQALLASFRKAS